MTQTRMEMYRQSEAIDAGLRMEAGSDLSTEAIFGRIEKVLREQPQLEEALGILDYVLCGSRDIPAQVWDNSYPLAIVNTGASEGIYIDVAMQPHDGDGSKTYDVATFKTLREDFEAYCLMGQIAGAVTRLIECWQCINWPLLEAASKQDGRMITIGIKEPGQNWVHRTVPDVLSSYQAIVGGYIEGFYTAKNGISFFCNEEGKLRGLEGNIGCNGDLIRGTVFAVRSDADGEFASVTVEDLVWLCSRELTDIAMWLPEEEE